MTCYNLRRSPHTHTHTRNTDTHTHANHIYTHIHIQHKHILTYTQITPNNNDNKNNDNNTNLMKTWNKTFSHLSAETANKVTTPFISCWWRPSPHNTWLPQARHNPQRGGTHAAPFSSTEATTPPSLPSLPSRKTWWGLKLPTNAASLVGEFGEGYLLSVGWHGLAREAP